MSSTELFMHYVCTPAEAGDLIDLHDKFWVCNCGCRENAGECKQSRKDVCLMFSTETGSSGSDMKEITKAEVEEILREASDKKLVARPFRNNDFTDTDGICFCCQDCCGYFTENNEHCNKGKFIEQTDMESCIHCGLCVEVCYFGARTLENGKLVVNRDKCYGCGLCEAVCPVSCIAMEQR
ncbi:MAG: 4Fe-4S binding protein [Candidatus Cloacimonetes bacterium]|nr:4Fe-4S binding protein [Candidatus Cloacimonadota bacterium]